MWKRSPQWPCAERVGSRLARRHSATRMPRRGWPSVATQSAECRIAGTVLVGHARCTRRRTIDFCLHAAGFFAATLPHILSPTSGLVSEKTRPRWPRGGRCPLPRKWPPPLLRAPEDVPEGRQRRAARLHVLTIRHTGDIIRNRHPRAFLLRMDTSALNRCLLVENTAGLDEEQKRRPFRSPCRLPFAP